MIYYFKIQLAKWCHCIRCKTQFFCNWGTGAKSEIGYYNLILCLNSNMFRYKCIHVEIHFPKSIEKIDIRVRHIYAVIAFIYAY